MKNLLEFIALNFIIIALCGVVSDNALAANITANIATNITTNITANAVTNIVENENSRATLISSHKTVKSGSAIEVAVLIEPRAGWHTYWENPGDAGIATSLEWQLPSGIKAGVIKWPVPSVINEDILAVYGFKDKVFLPTDIEIASDFAAKTVELAVKASWLVCEKICIPESAELAIAIPVAENSAQAMLSADSSLFKSANDNLPEKISSALSYKLSVDKIEITLPDNILHDNTIPDNANNITQPENSAYFFPRQQNVITYSGAQILANGRLLIPRNKNSADEEIPEELNGILIAGKKSYDISAKRADYSAKISDDKIADKKISDEKTSDEKTSDNKTSDDQISDDQISTAKTPFTAQQTKTSFALIIISALLGGLILNLMPCVLPILSLKALAIAGKSGHTRNVIIKQSLAYTSGVLLSFAAIAGLLISLQQAGEIIGWGYQMQSPPFIAFLAVLLFLVGLNLAGMFELPVLFGNMLAETQQHNLRGSFATGILAVMVAAPCTAPFMATAVGATISLPPLLSLLVFLAIGCGLSLPFLLIAVFPKIAYLLPRPGEWMIRFRQFLSFPMFASVVWLLWVLTIQSGAQGLLIVLITMLAISFIIWLKELCRDQSLYCRMSIILLLLAVLANGLTALANNSPATAIVEADSAKTSTAQNINTENKFSEELLAKLRAENIPVFVDATAAWCLTCQLNKTLAIDTKNTRAAFKRTGTRLLIADWTKRDEEITLFLKKFGYNGVPLYVYFPPGKEAQILPQLLSEDIIIEAIEGGK